MKNIILILLILLLTNGIFAQAGGNVIYEQNNRYKQNKVYNANQEQVWDFRTDNAYNYQIVENSNNKEMMFTVNAIMNVKADSYLAIFNITQTGETAKEVNELVNSKISGFLSELNTQNVKDEDVYTDMISLVPVYEYEVEKKLFSKTYTEVPKGFEMQKNIHIKFTDENMLDDIMTSAANNEIYDLIKVEYFVENNNTKYDELRTKSVDYMIKKKESFKKLDIDLDTIYHIVIEKSSVVYPIDRYKSYQAFSGTSLDAKKSKSVTSVRKPKTMFYNKLPYHKYDIVINPAILEPAVQFTYSLTVKYVIKDPIKKIEKQFILVSPDGIVKTLKID
ncbi:MAG: SIMPL domain-containing protein [Bacteroidales bacterium]|nr:SIMPL domain-containing protein [Bacteroidales bacterium]